MNNSNEINDINEIDLRLWYVIHTKPGNEHRAEINLSNQGIETFLPLFESQQYCCGRMLKKIKPLFPNYLFARLDIELHYYKVKWTRGVSRILGNGNGPFPLSERVIQTIREKMGKDNFVKLEEEWKEGDIVQITSGPFKEFFFLAFIKVISNGFNCIRANSIVEFDSLLGPWPQNPTVLPIG
jgi:transcriptional antiterminator RfaH